MNIVRTPSAVLTRPVREVQLFLGKAEPKSPTPLDKRTLRIVHDMIETLKSARNPEGVGLAANQVGLPLAIFVMMPKKNGDVIVCINPKILALGDGSQTLSNAQHLHEKPLKKNEQGLEGCLSIPQIWGEVDRAEKVHLSYVNMNGVRVERWFEGFEAIIVQHEMDHLNGIMFTQRALEQGHELVKEIGGGEFERYEI